MVIFTTCDTPDSVNPRFDKFFIKYFGDTGDQIGEDVAFTADGGYILVGTSDPDRSRLDSENTGDEDIILIKTDSTGNEEWTQIIDIAGNTDFGKAVIPIVDGYLVAGETLNTDFDGLYFRVDLLGNPDPPFIVDEGGNEQFRSITPLVDGYVITGSTDNAKQEPGQVIIDELDFLTVKIFTDLTEDPAWVQNKVQGRQGADIGIKSFPDPINSALITTFGFTDFPEFDVTIYDNETYNSLQFDGTVTGTDLYYGDTESQICADVAETPGGYLLTGTKTNAAGTNEMYYVKTTGLNVSTFALSIFTEFQFFGLKGKSIISSIDNQPIHLGEITYVNGDQDIFLGKTRLDGTTLWYETFGSSGQNEAAKVIQKPSREIVFTGTMNLSGQRKIFLIKTNSNGQLNLE
jgi:hypothetical protein